MRKSHNRIEYTLGQIINGCMLISEEPTVFHSGQKRRVAKFRCYCGKEFFAQISRVKDGNIKSCGCAKTSWHLVTHGGTDTDIYSIWNKIIDRIINGKNKSYHNYGGRGIGISDEWRNSFETFRDDMGPRPSDKHSVERKDNDLGYCKENCVWATRKEQANNKRNNVRITYLGITLTLPQWAEKYNLPIPLVRKRICRFKWSPEEAFNTPTNRNKRYLHPTKRRRTKYCAPCVFEVRKFEPEKN